MAVTTMIIIIASAIMVHASGQIHVEVFRVRMVIMILPGCKWLNSGSNKRKVQGPELERKVAGAHEP